MKFDIQASGKKVVEGVVEEAMSRSYPAANELRSAAMVILRGQRSGRTYRVPNSKRTYTASAPGEPPAVRTGNLRASWMTKPGVLTQANGKLIIKPNIESQVPYIKYLEPELSGRDPGEKVLPRPFVKAIQERAKPNIQRIYRRPYLKG